MCRSGRQALFLRRHHRPERVALAHEADQLRKPREKAGSFPTGVTGGWLQVAGCKGMD